MKMPALLMLCSLMLATAQPPSALLERLEARLAALEQENQQIKAKLEKLGNDEGGAKQGSRTGRGELRLFVARNECPLGWKESNITKGYVITGRPEGGRVGMQLNEELKPGEAGRVGVHSHTTLVHDPGHSHNTSTPTGKVSALTHVAAAGTQYAAVVGASTQNELTSVSKTGIQIESAIEVSVQENHDGEHLPLVYVLICERV
jgi:hypothetical protein